MAEKVLKGGSSDIDNTGGRRSSYSLEIMPSVKNLGKEDTESPFKAEGITSEVYSESNPPKDWCDVGLLIPHEAIRREIAGMVKSVKALKADSEDWKILYFSEWYVDVFAVVIHSHHENEENIYFPWIATKATIPEKKMAKDHKALVDLLNEIEEICKNVIGKQGKDCQDEIAKLQEKVPTFETEMNAHLKEEEEMIPQLLRDNFTQKEEAPVIEKILQREGLHGCRIFVPAIIAAMKDWATADFVEEFLGSMPGPIRGLVEGYYIPDYETSVWPLRDAPLLDVKPTLSKVGCCKISFCFPCIL